MYPRKECRMEKEDLVPCRNCGVHEPANTIKDGICIECVNEHEKINQPAPIEQIKVEKTRNPIPASMFIWGAFLSFFVGVYVILKLEQLWGLFFILTVTPCLFLYPIIRFLFGGKDSIAAAAVTIITEEVLKSKIEKAVKKRYNKKRKY